MARIFPICSSSEGNATFIGTRGHGVLVDAGCSFRSLKSALSLCDTDFGGIEAVFITHEHSDHIKALEQLFKHTTLAVFASRGTRDELYRMGKIPEGKTVYDISEGYKSAAFEVRAFHTSHDTAESVGYTIDYGGERYAVCTDTGVVTKEAEQALCGSRAVLLESNHDVDMLRGNKRYPFELKKRILGDRGHLSNDACAEFSEKLVKSGARFLILGHLSRENNTPSTALDAVTGRLLKSGLRAERDYSISVAPIMTSGEFISC